MVPQLNINETAQSIERHFRILGGMSEVSAMHGT